MKKFSFENINKLLIEKPWITWVSFVVALVTVFLLGLLAASIMERRSESLIAFAPKVKINELESRNKIWGENYPREYTSFLKTAEGNFRSKYNGSNLVDELSADPYMVILWAGYAFSKDYSKPRGHFYAVTDIRNTLRTGAPKNENEGPQPATCWTCKSPDVPRMMKEMGISNFYSGKWAAHGPHINNPIGCADCHDPKTMNLTITRPALIEAFARQGKDVNESTHQEKRTLVCAQCHVEYYFKATNKGADPKKPGTYLTFPWDKGKSVEDIERYYDEMEFSDWTHQLSRAKMLKAQHPDYEMWAYGIHAKRGVSCADCHMPYISEGGIKSTSHHIQSPLNNINQSCQVCHRENEEELKQNVYANQDRVYELRGKVEENLVRAHIEAKLAWDKGATEDEMKHVLKLIREASWRWDFAVAGHGNSAHAPVECARILAGSLERSGNARVLLARILAKHGVSAEVLLPDLSTKEKAQKFIGLDVSKLKNDKDEFLKTIIPKWDLQYVQEINKK
ncbi:MAG: ammonia-forming cytochrome c nitrite reductase [Oligoflexia bacterium]|nr:ammonia-forming cytochrome c nitrite reductase [Oligoflexia bacterium]